ncbi:hypothetical protein J2T13_000836 [Paenibacillus sp. DS2015]|uniref:helix-turn-helix domain-containing protein n=1 Tax=Paenibacillus sp. DS2015 TaxID=3373917 RepID=UPI003D2605DF
MRVSSAKLTLPSDKNRTNIYTACEDMDFHWSNNEVRSFEKMWLEGLGVKEIAEKLQRDPDEVLILVIDRANRNKRIKARTHGVCGVVS